MSASKIFSQKMSQRKIPKALLLQSSKYHCPSNYMWIPKPPKKKIQGILSQLPSQTSTMSSTQQWSSKDQRIIMKLFSIASFYVPPRCNWEMPKTLITKHHGLLQHNSLIVKENIQKLPMDLQREIMSQIDIDLVIWKKNFIELQNPKFTEPY